MTQITSHRVPASQDDDQAPVASLFGASHAVPTNLNIAVQLDLEHSQDEDTDPEQTVTPRTKSTH